MYRRYNLLNEANAYQSLYSNEDVIEKLGEVDVFDSGTKKFVKKNAGEIIKVASDALYKMHRDYNFLYQFITKCKLMYIPAYPSKITNTMAVDNYNNLWMNLTFIYDTCKMDTDRVFGILFHEMFHIFFNHLLRFDKEFPKEMFAATPGVYKKANMKANLCMDYEVNASMVDDGIVSPEFFVVMNGLYKKEYTGMTWEEILHKYGDKEYDEWLAANGESLDDVEKKMLDAIEEAAKVLMDPDADDFDKREARKKLKKKMDEILGRKPEDGEKTLQDEIDDLGKTKLADHGDIARDLEEISDDLNRGPSRMSPDELSKTMRDMDKLADDIVENAEALAEDFGKSAEEIAADAEKARQAMKDAMEKINKGGLTKEEKEELLDKAKDALEDVISDEVEKEKLKKKREERDAKREEAKKERMKKTHPMRKMIIVLKNLADLNKIGLISEKTRDILEQCMADMEVLTEKKFSEMKKRDMKDVSDHFGELKDSFLPDLVELINNETILQKTEEDMKHILDTVFEHVYNAFRKIFDPGLDDDAKGSLFKMAAQKMRTIGKILKTQKKWRVSDEFKEAYLSEMKRLMEIRKTGGDEALMKELLDLGVINPLCLDEHGEELYKKITGKSSKFDDLFDIIDKMSGKKKEEISDEEVIDGLLGILKDEGASEEDLENARDAMTKAFKGEDGDEKGAEKEVPSYSDFNDDVEPYEGKMYYILYKNDEGTTVIELSDIEDGCEDSDYEKFGVRFEKDFPEYRVEEMMESVFEVCYANTMDPVELDEIKEKVESNPNYVEGEW